LKGTLPFLGEEILQTRSQERVLPKLENKKKGRSAWKVSEGRPALPKLKEREREKEDMHVFEWERKWVEGRKEPYKSWGRTKRVEKAKTRRDEKIVNERTKKKR